MDDAVFSCGGLIAQLAQAGERVLVVNIFSEYSDNSGRHEEESQVAEFLNIDIVHVGELDAILRRKSYKSLSRLFSLIEESDRDQLPALAAKLKKVLSEISYDTIYVPLGIGWHVDHLLTHELGELAAEKSTIRYYEDAPYCLLPQFTSHRLRQFGTKRPSGIFGAARAAGRAMMSMAPMQKFSRSPFRFLIAWVVTYWFWHLLRRQRHTKARAQKFAPQIIEVNSQLAAKIQASQLYRSQFGEFYLDHADCESRLREYARQTTGESAYYERYWWPGQKPHGG